MKKLIAMIVVTGLFLSISVVPGHAGSRERRMVEGILIGTGAVILGAALANEIRGDDGERVKVEQSRHYKQSKRHPRHARVERMWVEPRYKQRWNPGHYNRRGHWVEGRYDRIVVRDGFWKERRGREHRRY